MFFQAQKIHPETFSILRNLKYPPHTFPRWKLKTYFSSWNLRNSEELKKAALAAYKSIMGNDSKITLSEFSDEKLSILAQAQFYAGEVNRGFRVLSVGSPKLRREVLAIPAIKEIRKVLELKLAFTSLPDYPEKKDTLIKHFLHSAKSSNSFAKNKALSTGDLIYTILKKNPDITPTQIDRVFSKDQLYWVDKSTRMTRSQFLQYGVEKLPFQYGIYNLTKIEKVVFTYFALQAENNFHKMYRDFRHGKILFTRSIFEDPADEAAIRLFGFLYNYCENRNHPYFGRDLHIARALLGSDTTPLLSLLLSC
jgi:hypothetical protein